ncbi:nSTAND1 domain-containing NTPase [Cystobacter fuscus]|uniref:nSTAND1 domain-containing NTPase n=1 Tax=Cystobacter fuscus TaxID=43 RepID=UPI0006869BB3|nr:caspase family protein [Cystobacter fuscus]
MAIVIGINTYAHGIPPLSNAVRDASSVADALEGQGFEVICLLDDQASLSALTTLLSQQLASLQPPPDRLLVYFAGHGLAHTDEHHHLSGFLLPADARRDDFSSYWRMDALREALRDLPCRHLLLILDCCFAGAFPHSSSRDLRAPSLPAPLFLERFRHFSSRRSFQLLASTAHDELASDRLLAKPSQESLGDGHHSPFALALLQALQHPSSADTNQDGLITASELYTFLRDRLIDLLPVHCQQTPALWPLDWHDSGEFLFLLSDTFPTLPLAAPLSRHSNPYLGLRPFASAHRHLFFGRERLIDSLLGHLRVQPLLLLCGPSGVGKSSAVHAGLLPRLGDDPTWRVPRSLRPSAQPLHALSSWLASMEPGPSVPSATGLAVNPHVAAACVVSFLTRNEDLSLLLVVDPLEELVTTCPDDATRRAFLQALGALLQLSHPRLRMLWLLRSDFEPHFHSLLSPSGVTSARWHEGRLPLPPMNRDELRQCIEKPAESCVLFFEPGLVERLLDDVDQMPGALPLLSVALSELFDACLASGREDRTLSFEDYRSIGGGIAGALQRRAELVFAGTPPPASDGQSLPPLPRLGELPAFQHTLRNVLLRMVSPEEGGLARRRVPRAELEYTHPEENDRVQRALRTLEACRLVVASDDGGPCVEPAHDALLSAWPRLHDWALQARRELLSLRRVSHAASEWHRHGRDSDFLWADGRLEQLGLAPVALRRAALPLALGNVSPGSQPTEPLVFNATESGFLRASAVRRRVLRARRSSVALTVGIALVLLTMVALIQANRAQAKAGEAEASAWEAQRRKEDAESSAREAHEQKEKAESLAEEARRQEAAAVSNFAEAQRQRESSERHAHEALEQQYRAEANAQEALTQKLLAEANAHEAQRQQELAEANAQRAREQQYLAEINAQEALSQRNSSESNAREARRQQETAEANAREAQRQRENAEANAREAQRQQRTAESNAQEALEQQRTAESNAQEALEQQQIAEANAREVLLQKEIAETNALRAHVQQEAAEKNALEARKQQEAAEKNALEARKQQELVLVNVRISRARALIDKNPTQALLVLREVYGMNEASDNEWLQSALQVSHHIVSQNVFIGHNGSVEMVQLSPDGTHVLTVSDDGTARLWRADGTGQSRVLSSHSGAMNSAVFSPDGSLMLTVSDAGTTRIWSVTDTTQPLHIFKDPENAHVRSAIFSPGGNRILTTSDSGTLYLWNVKGEDLVKFEGHTDRVTSAVFSPDGNRILTASSDGTARLWSLEGQELHKYNGHQDEVTSASFSPDGAYVLTSSADYTARLWRINGTKAQHVFRGHSAHVNTATFSPDGSLILTAADDNTARIWPANGSREPLVLSGHSGWVTSAVFSPDGSLILTASSDGTARLWPTSGMKNPIILSGHSDWVNSATFSPDGSRILTASIDGTARLWRIRGQGQGIRFFFNPPDANMPATISPEGTRILTSAPDGTVYLFSINGTSQRMDILQGHKHPVNTATFSPDDSLLLTASDDGTARLWNVLELWQPPRVMHVNKRNGVTSAIFSPDGSRILTTSNGPVVRLWHTYSSEDEPFLRLKGHKGPVTIAAFSPDGSLIATGAEDHTVRLWRADREEPPRLLNGHEGSATSATFSPNGAYILVASEDGQARLWLTSDTTKPLRAFSGSTNPLNSATFSPDGSLILTASDDGIARIWRTDGTGKPIILEGHTGPVSSASFTPDGTRVFTVSDDTTTRLWSLDEQSTPLVLRPEENQDKCRVDAHLTRDGTRALTVCGNGLVRIWPLRPEPLREYFQTATTACLSALERMEYLLETPAVARAAHERCERKHGRAP